MDITQHAFERIFKHYSSYSCYPSVHSSSNLFPYSSLFHSLCPPSSPSSCVCWRSNRTYYGSHSYDPPCSLSLRPTQNQYSSRPCHSSFRSHILPFRPFPFYRMIEEDQSEINVRGPPLRPKRKNPMSAPVLILEESDDEYAQPRRTRARRHPTTPKNTAMISRSNTSDEVNVSLSSPSTSTYANTLELPRSTTRTHIPHTHRPTLLPASFLSLPPKPWYEYSSEESPMETIQSFIQDLYIFDVEYQEGNGRSLHGVPLCPFILAHLQPSNRIIPHVPLTLPSCPEYFLILLYAIKETPNHPNLDPQYVLVFSLIHLGQTDKCPSLVGTKSCRGFIDQIQENVHKEKERVRRLLTDTSRILFPLRTSGV